jgi:hypothetical protein
VTTNCPTGSPTSRSGSPGSPRPKAELEAEAKATADEERRIEAEKQKSREANGRKKPGKPAAPPSDEPAPKAQRNFTDPQSRILKTKDGARSIDQDAGLDRLTRKPREKVNAFLQSAGRVTAVDCHLGHKGMSQAVSHDVFGPLALVENVRADGHAPRTLCIQPSGGPA